MDSWLAMAAGPEDAGPLGTYAQAVLAALDARGALFTRELERASGLLPEHFEAGLSQLIARGIATCDSFGGLRRLLGTPSRRRGAMKRPTLFTPGRWSRLRAGEAGAVAADAEFAAARLLDRYGVMFRQLLERERLPVPWRDLVRVYRRLELRGEIRGGRFVQRFSGEQFARPEAVELLRRLRRAPAAVEPGELWVSAADPLNLDGILTPEDRIPSQARKRVLVA
jgi:ATP-dependent Lhr-like helicase